MNGDNDGRRHDGFGTTDFVGNGAEAALAVRGRGCRGRRGRGRSVDKSNAANLRRRCRHQTSCYWFGGVRVRRRRRISNDARR